MLVNVELMNIVVYVYSSCQWKNTIHANAALLHHYWSPPSRSVMRNVSQPTMTTTRHPLLADKLSSHSCQLVGWPYTVCQTSLLTWSAANSGLFLTYRNLTECSGSSHNWLETVQIDMCTQDCKVKSIVKFCKLVTVSQQRQNKWHTCPKSAQKKRRDLQRIVSNPAT